MNLLEVGAQLLSERLGINVDTGTITNALQRLLGDGQGNIDLGALAQRMVGEGGLDAILHSWLGDGANDPIAAERLTGLLGEQQVQEFANEVGADRGQAAEALSEVVPQLVDRASSGGNLLEAAGGLNGLINLGKSLFRQ